MTRDPVPTSRRRTTRSRLGWDPWFAAFALLAACGAPAVPPGLEASLGTSSVTIVRGGSAQIQVTLTRLGAANDPVALNVSTLPANVTATFAPATLAGATLTSTLTIDVAPGASDASAYLSVVATSGSLTDDAALTLEITSLTVLGRVEGLLGRPITGIPVTSQGETDFTDPSGSFTLTGLSVPYDLVVTSAEGNGALHAFEGMTSPSPIVRPYIGGSAFPTLGGGATVQGSILGGAVGVGAVVRVCIEGLVVAVYGCDSLGATETDFSFGAPWFEGATVAARLHAFRLEVDANDVPVAYLGYETIDLNLSDGIVALADLDFEPVATDALAGTLTYPVTLADTGLSVWARFGPNLSMPILYVDDPAVAFDILVPVLPGLRYDVVFSGSGGDDTVVAWKLDAGLDAGGFALAAPAQLVAPLDGVTGADPTTSFATTAAGGARTYLWAPDGGGPLLALTTRRTTVTIPDPASGGLALPFPNGLAYAWGAIGHGDADIDTAAAGGMTDYVNLVYAYNSMGGPGLDGDRTVSLPAVTRDLTFAP